MTDLIGKTFIARTRLYLPTGHYVEEGEKFRLLAVHVEAGIRPDLWLVAGNAELIGDEPLRIQEGAPKGKLASAPAAPATPVADASSAAPAEDEKAKASR